MACERKTSERKTTSLVFQPRVNLGLAEDLALLFTRLTDGPTVKSPI
jgi:hypothetical protein